MSNNPLKITIAYLYPDFLQGFCDKANLDVLKLRCRERNINVEIDEIRNDDKINSAKYDFYYISGNNIEVLPACNKRLKNNYSQLKSAVDSGAVMLAINCGYILFGKDFQLNNSPLYTAAEIFNISTQMLDEPVSEKIIAKCSLIDDNIVGYINRYTQTILLETQKPFLVYKDEKTEGAIVNNSIGTYISSPILAQNPVFCDYIISNCLQYRYKCKIQLTKLTDDIEWYSHNYFLEAK